MILLLALLFCCCDALSTWANDYDNDPRPICLTEFDVKPLNNRIVGGVDAGVGTFPYAVAIVMGGPGDSEFRADSSFCAGTLITDSHVLTASHCLYKNQYLMNHLWLDVNDYDTKDNTESRNYVSQVERIDMHPKYVDETFDNDIAIITLSNPVPSNETIRMAILPPSGGDLDVGTICTVWGWGRTSYKGPRASVMKKVDVPITSREDCQKHLSHSITKNMICAGGKEGEDACLGDSGGSLLTREGNVYCLAGIVSFGKGCAMKDVSGVYTNVRRYVDWIYENTRTAGCKPRILQ